jgi:hypothetical protein
MYAYKLIATLALLVLAGVNAAPITTTKECEIFLAMSGLSSLIHDAALSEDDVPGISFDGTTGANIPP